MVNSPDNIASSKPYKLIPFPAKLPNLAHPAGHDKFRNDCLHGTLFLNLIVQTPLHVSTGVVVMGDDIGNSSIPLIKTMTQGINEELIIQGSSLKGCIRSVYEAITNSTLGVISKDYERRITQEYLPSGQYDSLCSKNNLCPASRIFGALNWQGLVEFSDARCDRVYSIGFMPSLYSPQPKLNNRTFNPNYFDENGKVKGRKFYYQTDQAVDAGERGIPVQQAGIEYIFNTRLQFMNLKPEELGTLLIVLGQDSQYPIALKVGAGKPVGMGTMEVEITEARVLQGQNVRDRYSSYTTSETGHLTGDQLEQFIKQQIQVAHSTSLIEKNQLEEVAEVLGYPTERQPIEGNY
ncbi:CRISPR-associated protein [Oscillatoriales cyanobacterium USR001]|nr:CRISPR-associated protein [Oscillatoriales cyanobacterium USR001]